MKAIIVSDIHAPYHSSRAINSAIAVIRKVKPDHLINLGDVVDLDIISKFRDTSEGHATGSTILMQTDVASAIMGSMMYVARKSNPRCKGTFIDGNHEHRLENYLVKNSELMGITDIGRLLRLKENGYRHVRYGEDCFIGKYLMCHGYYVGQSAGKKHLDMIKGSVIFGHMHSPTTYFGSSKGKKPVAHGIGCLCDTNIRYLNGTPTNWVNSIGLIDGNQFSHITL